MPLNLMTASCLIWYISVVSVIAIGVFKIRRSYASNPLPLASSQLGSEAPHITIIRPVKGLEPYLYECLAATFKQEYPSHRLTIYLCIPDRDDPAYPVLERVLADNSQMDAQILVEEEDPNLTGSHGRTCHLGPNPKIRNMSRAYREAKGDLVWIIDCNVWVAPAVAGRMVDILCGFLAPSSTLSKGRCKKYKFVHQLPLVTDITASSPTPNEDRFGGQLEELFLSTAHAKFYTAINTVAIAPCILGKSNMFRRSHLNALTSPNSPLPVQSTASVPEAQQAMPGIDYFSSNICEDHLIGDLLWKNPVPDSVREAAAWEGLNSASSIAQPSIQTSWENHALLPPHPSNIAIQPTASLSLGAYLSRRVRWLRVRKFTVTAATLVEPGTESLLCSLYGAYAFTTLPYFRDPGVPGEWTVFWGFWLLSVALWAMVDWWVWNMLQNTISIHRGNKHNASVPPFHPQYRRPLLSWLTAWAGRELLAFPIWAYAFFGGVSVIWRGRTFRVGVDMRVREISRVKSD